MGGEEFIDGRPPEITQLAEEKLTQEEPSNSNLPQWRPMRGAEDFRAEVERPIIDGRTAERTMCPEVPRYDGTTQLTPLVRRRGLWDEDEVNPPRSYTSSHALEEGHSQNVDPFGPD